MELRSKEAVLADINRDLPPLDWRGGAQRYLADYFDRYSRDQIEDFVFNKPLGALTPEDPVGSLRETVFYLFNFANAVQLLQLERGARVLDVACGGGWFAHWLRKIGCEAHGLDLSADFVDLARRRLVDDPYLACGPDEAAALFRVHDIERDPLPANLHGAFDVIVLESCLHHFFDPIAAMTHLAEGLAEGGVVLVIEGENRRGAIRDEYMQVMLETSTLERPYPRELLLEVLQHAGLEHVEFLGLTPGFVPQSAPVARQMSLALEESTAGSNICLCARDETAIRRLAPSYGIAPEPEPQPEPQHVPKRAPILTRLVLSAAGLVRDAAPGWMRPALRAVWRRSLLPRTPA